MANIEVTIIKNKSYLNKIREPVHLDINNWHPYLKSLDSIQKNVNSYLTELVEKEKIALDETNEQDSESETEDPPVKRKLKSYGNAECKKNKT